MVGQTREITPTPANDVIDWKGHNPYYFQMKTGTSTIKPGMLVYGSTDIAQIWAGSGNVRGFCLYKESPSESQKADWSSAYDIQKIIAVVPLGVDCNIKAFCGTITAFRVSSLLKPDGSTPGAVSPMALIFSGSQIIQQKLCGRALEEATSGAGERAMISVGM